MVPPTLKLRSMVRPERRPDGSPPSRDGSGRPRRNPRQRSAQRPSERGATTDAARLAAYTVLRAVAEGGYANLELPKELRRRGLHGRDAAFATELTYGTARMRGLYDPIIVIAADRPTARIDDAVLDTLRLGAHQLLGMRVPPHAAVDETVGLARRVNGAGASTLVNAVMRRISEADLAEWLDRVLPQDDPLDRLAIEHSHPRWVVKALRQALLGHGRATAKSVDAELAALLAADNEPPRVTLVARPGLATVADLAAAGATPSEHLSIAATMASGGDPGSIAAVRDGRAAVQDEGSQVVALALAAVPHAQPPERERWLDLCAGPGGKAGLLAALAVQRGADFVANEASPQRADLVTSTLRAAARAAAAAGTSLEVHVGDGRAIGEAVASGADAAYDRVLVDTPCTGLGALRRRPEARWRRTPTDLAPLGVLQRQLLASAIRATAPGGIIAYVTCSPHLAETTFVVADVLKKHPEVDQLDARPFVAAVTHGWSDLLGRGPGVQLWPHVHRTDAMFLAILRRR